MDDFFAPLGNTKPYLKVAFEGFAGSGKTHTAALIAKGLHERIGSTKPVVIFDTERASKFLRPLFDAAGIQVLVRDSRSLADLKETMKRCREGASDILLIDSISHVWEAFVEAYKARTKRSRIEFQDWGLIKPTWKKEFSDPFVRDPYHCIFTGRAGHEYENEVNSETGKREVYKSGIKMKVEGETAYEPDLLVLMERFEEILTNKKKVWREATIIKDRSTLIDGKTFKNPDFSAFSPAIECILRDPESVSTTAERDPAALVRTEEDKRAWFKRRDIALEKIEAELVRRWPGQGKEEKKAKVEALETFWHTTSWKEIEGYSPDALEAGLRKLIGGAANEEPDLPVDWGNTAKTTEAQQ